MPARDPGGLVEDGAHPLVGRERLAGDDPDRGELAGALGVKRLGGLLLATIESTSSKNEKSLAWTPLNAACEKFRNSVAGGSSACGERVDAGGLRGPPRRRARG